MNYYREQVRRLRKSERYAVKIETREEYPDEAGTTFTKWLIITPDRLERIADILAEGDE